MSEIRTHVTFLYPGSFYPEESGSKRIDNYEVATVLAAAPEDEGWFAAEVTTGVWLKWTSESGEEKWSPGMGEGNKFRVYIGEALTVEDVEALEGDHHILVANMRGNGWEKVCRTRRGNFQPIEANDFVLASVTA